MDFTEKDIERVKNALMSVIARFASDVREITVIPKQTFNGNEFLAIKTNEIRMTPCVFQSLHIQGDVDMEDEESGILYATLSWNWRTFSDVGNGTELASIKMRPSFDGYIVTEIKLR